MMGYILKPTHFLILMSDSTKISQLETESICQISICVSNWVQLQSIREGYHWLLLQLKSIFQSTDLHKWSVALTETAMQKSHLAKTWKKLANSSFSKIFRKNPWIWNAWTMFQKIKLLKIFLTIYNT